ncbi:tRNA lysidine(34) synthetase TilS [Candidatus Saccharibacteria bacterium]|nr:tRNA lysidine(34) synthetase TilS [Candidatus Saccharibacteria bacterium]
MKLIVAVSGGIDSVVLLDELARSGRYQLIVAHFDHGMRQDSAADARFVAGLAKRHNLKFESRREELGKANEELARSRRYQFLFEIADEHGARLTTAHHLDDLVETVAINLTRGTRWRGLAGMSDERIWRPFLGRTKSELKEYATKHRLEWVEDETNLMDIYQRNRLRSPLSHLSLRDKQKIFELWQNQAKLRGEISQEAKLRSSFVSNRYYLTMISDEVARELVYANVLDNHGVSLLTSQLNYLLIAAKTGRADTVWQISKQIQMKLTKKNAIIERVE